MIVFAKTVTNGAAPLGGVIVRREIHDALMHGPPHLAELMHGYTCSGHPLACAAALAMLDVIERRAAAGSAAPHWRRTSSTRCTRWPTRRASSASATSAWPPASSSRPTGAPGPRGAAAQAAAFDHGVLTRAPGDTLVLAPPFVCSEPTSTHGRRAARGHRCHRHLGGRPMRALVYTQPNEVQLHDRADAGAAPGEVVLRDRGRRHLRLGHARLPRPRPAPQAGPRARPRVRRHRRRSASPRLGARHALDRQPADHLRPLRVLRAGPQQPVRQPHDGRHDARRARSRST